MKQTIEWLKHVEQLACSFYTEAAAAYKEYPDRSSFFLHLAEEETWHGRVMDDALEYLRHHTVPPFAITVDNATRQKIETPFLRTLELLKAGTFTWKDVLDCMMTTESSEWNHVFLYVVDLLKKERQFMPVASRMHHHLTEIRDFLRSLPQGEDYMPAIRNLPQVWKEQILILDDEPSILSFLTRLLADEGVVEKAVNGAEGLQKVKDNYFDVIVSDVSMPVMNGIEFYKQAAALDPDIARRIIFFSGMVVPDIADFFRENNLRYLVKPAPIEDILAKVHEVIRSAGEPVRISENEQRV
jgi:CheY-like chemotaxis protein